MESCCQAKVAQFLDLFQPQSHTTSRFQLGFQGAKVSDFGSANLARLSQTLGEGAIIYSAPETFPNTDPHACPPRQTTKIDVYSYGILLCEVVVCQFPDPAHYHDMLRQVQTQWQSLYNLIVSCTRRNPDERPTMLQILDELNSVPHP